MKPTIEELNAGNAFRDSMVCEADGRLQTKRCITEVPFWHGWIIMEAFLAGIEYQKKK